MATIFELTEDRMQLFKLLENSDWDVSVIQDTLDGDGFDDKVNDWVRVMANDESTEKALRQEAAALIERANQYKNKVKNMKKALHQVFKNLDHTSYKVALATFSRSQPAPVVKFDESKLTADYIIFDTVKTPDKQKIEADAKAGKEVPGAYFEVPDEKFTMRRK
ncbi:siphovirus Gp157 family protein [Vibrio harveyi]